MTPDRLTPKPMTATTAGQQNRFSPAGAAATLCLGVAVINAAPYPSSDYAQATFFLVLGIWNLETHTRAYR